MSNEPAFMRVPIELIEAGTNVRVDDQGLDSLAASIAKHGVLQPITVVPLEGDAGLTVMPCLARPRDRAEVRVLTQIAENRDRRAMSPYEEALAYGELRKLGMTQQQIAAAVGTAQPSVSERLILLKYPEPVVRAVHNRRLGLSDALSIPLVLAKETDPVSLGRVCSLGGRQVRNWVRKQLDENAAKGRVIAKRTRYETVNIDTDIVEDVRAAAATAGVKVVEFVRRALTAAIQAQDTPTAEATNG
jgi:ParB family chromosome partitioning protein